MCGKLLLLHRSGWVTDECHCFGICGASPIVSDARIALLPSCPSLYPADHTHRQTLFYLAFSKSPVTETQTHTCLLSEDGCTLYQRQDPGGRQKIHIRGRWSEIVFGLSAREVLKHPCVNRYLVDSRWCSSITGTVTKFCSGSFSRPLHFLSSQEM